MDMKPVPEVGKIYSSFDDGKIRESRKYDVTVKKVVPFPDVDETTLRIWETDVSECNWLYATSTDFFVFTEKEEGKEVFARTKDGGWFGIGDFLGNGRLDIDGSLLARLLNT